MYYNVFCRCVFRSGRCSGVIQCESGKCEEEESEKILWNIIVRNIKEEIAFSKIDKDFDYKYWGDCEYTLEKYESRDAFVEGVQPYDSIAMMESEVWGEIKNEIRQ